MAIKKNVSWCGTTPTPTPQQTVVDAVIAIAGAARANAEALYAAGEALRQVAPQEGEE